MEKGDWWWDERMADAVFAERIKDGRCGNCGAYDGPTHRCPTRQNYYTEAKDDVLRSEV